MPVVDDVDAPDLTASDEVVHDRRSFGDAVLASVAVPGVLPPVHRDGHVLVDAGCRWAVQPEAATGARPPSSHVGQRA